MNINDESVSLAKDVINHILCNVSGKKIKPATLFLGIYFKEIFEH